MKKSWPNDFIGKVIEADCLDVLRGIPDETVDSLITDPPASIGYMGKPWDTFKGRDDFISFLIPIFNECLRVLKPGAHAFVWALPRTSHWTAWALEESGFVIRDVVLHLFGQGRPKSMDIGKEVDKRSGTKRKVIGSHKIDVGIQSCHMHAGHPSKKVVVPLTAATSLDALKWNGWGTALKPASEHWILCRKPMENGLSIAENVLKWGTGALNIDACRIPGMTGTGSWGSEHEGKSSTFNNSPGKREFRIKPIMTEDGDIARWPANVTHDGSDSVINTFGEDAPEYIDGGDSPSKFFYCSKASPRDREEGLDEFLSDDVLRTTSKGIGNTLARCPNHGSPLPSGKNHYKCGCPASYEETQETRRKGTKNNHPTVKSTPLLRWLCRMITPPNGIVLDPFFGSGSTGKACVLEEFLFVGIEKDHENCVIAKARIDWIRRESVRIMALEKLESEARERQMKMFDDKPLLEEDP